MDYVKTDGSRIHFHWNDAAKTLTAEPANEGGKVKRAFKLRVMPDKETTPFEYGGSKATTKLAAKSETTAKTNLTVDLGGGVTMDFMLIQPGTFTMVEKQAAHKVTLTKPFYLGKYHVTQEQWTRVMETNPSHFQGPKHPVETVSWEDCQLFVRKLGEKGTGQTFRLPTEAEWEYACRAGSTSRWCYGDAEAGLAEFGWYDLNSGGATHPVGEKKPNAWGLHDMHGNVWQWCADWHGDYPQGDITDPTGASTGSARATRGGEWNRNAYHATSAFRGKTPPAQRLKNIGLRLVLEAR
jgi:formylglycine-generating enzyme required for sulfatase activity